MRKIEYFCDVCGKQMDDTNDAYALQIRWINEASWSTFEICKECKDKSELLVTEKEKEDERNTKKHDWLLGLVRLFFRK